MKAMLQFIAAAVCVAVLTACGGGGDKTPIIPVVVQPAYKMTETATGSGRAAVSGDLVTFTYVGYLYDSTKTDFKGAKVESSVDLGSTFTGTVGVGAMLSGWDQTLLGMQPGTKRTAVLPANLAYGANTRDKQSINGIDYAAITANSPMVYDFVMIYVTPQVTIPNQPAPTTLTTSDLTIGTGTAVVSGKTVTVRYTGWLYDGTRSNFKGSKFDDNQTAASPLSTVVGGTDTIPGFNTGIIGMQVGGTRTVIIPPSLGYGATAQAGSATYGVAIPANSTLVFDITLISIQ